MRRLTTTKYDVKSVADRYFKEQCARLGPIVTFKVTDKKPTRTRKKKAA